MGLKRQSNFASRGRRPVAAIGLVLWALAVAMAALLVAALADVGRLEDDLAQLQDHNGLLSTQVETLEARARTAPDIDALRRQSEAVRLFNTLTGPRQMPLVDLLALLEEKLPAGTWISQMSYNAETGRLSVSVRTDTERALPEALRTLEIETALRDVILERQIRLQQGGRQLAQYDIEARAE